MEIVTEPDIRTAEQGRRYAEELQLLLRSIGASDADMERGQLRVEANVSLRPRGTEPFGTRVEVKNMNSFRSVERAIEFEIERQAAALDAGEALRQETRGWSDDRGETYHMRIKETSDDYRYFPEPDLPPLHVDPAWLAALRASLPELPAARRTRYAETLGLSGYDAAVLVADPDAATAVRGDDGRRPRSRREVGRELGDRGVPAPAQRRRRADRPSSPAELAVIVAAVDAGELSARQRQGGRGRARRDGAGRPRRSSPPAASARSRTPVRSPRPSATSWRPTRRPSPTTGPARRRRSASSSGRS